MLLPISIDNLSSYLKPPIGYKFDKGLATTYSLHLDILLTVPMFLDGALSEKNAVLQNYQAVVMMINSLKERFKVYVQKGEIKTSTSASKKASKLYELLRPMIKEVQRDTTHSSFHPKLWLLRYVSSDKEYKYKLIVLSKNMTNSKDLDIAVAFDGEYSNEPQQQINIKLASFIKETLHNDYFEVKELKKIRWQNIDNFELDDILFIPKDNQKIPFYDRCANNQKSKCISQKVIVFSPFVDSKIFKTKNHNLLITREEEVDSQFCKYIYKVNDSLYEDEEEGEFFKLFEKDDSVNKSNPINLLHAKIYVYTNRGSNWLSIGSANATRRGFERNDEVLICMKAPANFYNQIKDFILDDKHKIFVEANIEKTEEENDEKRLKEESLSEIDRVKNELLKKNDSFVVLYDNGYLILNYLQQINLQDIKMKITPVSKVEFKDMEEKLEWKVQDSQITGWFRVVLELNKYHREFLVNSSNFKNDNKYIKAIEQEADECTEGYFEANIFALLSDGNSVIPDIELQYTQSEQHNEHCYNDLIDNGIVDLMLDRYATNKKVYKEVYNLLSSKQVNKPLNNQVDYTKIIKALPKI